MITSSLLYLLIIAIIGTFFGYIKQTSGFKVFSSHIYIVFFIYASTAIMSYLGLFANSDEIQKVYYLVRNNLLPAMIFLIFIDLDFKELLKGSGIGCSCNIGPKRYWFILALSFFASFISQFIALHVEQINHLLSAVIISALLGTLISFTPIKKINGIRDIATTMLYLLVALFGSMF